MNIKISYDGAYPNLCAGKLVVTADGIVYTFPERCLISGGRCFWDDRNHEEIIEQGPWEICAWPESMPEDVRQVVIVEINKQIPLGCCGGCL